VSAVRGAYGEQGEEVEGDHQTGGGVRDEVVRMGETLQVFGNFSFLNQASYVPFPAFCEVVDVFSACSVAKQGPAVPMLRTILSAHSSE
jgi:hypothetical protein